MSFSERRFRLKYAVAISSIITALAEAGLTLTTIMLHVHSLLLYIEATALTGIVVFGVIYHLMGKLLRTLDCALCRVFFLDMADREVRKRKKIANLVSALINCGMLVLLFNFLCNIPISLSITLLVMFLAGFTVLDAVTDKVMRECCTSKCIETQE